MRLGSSELAAPFAFVAAFSAFNALYWLWASVDAAERQSYKSGELKLSAERDQIRGLIGRLGPERAQLLANDGDFVRASEFFATRTPIRDMRFRERDEDGAADKGAVLRAALGAPDASARVAALAEILYQIRCNLVHGSKGVDGTGPDNELLRVCVPALRRMVSEALAITRDRFG